jgi:hypothetical protein
MKIGTRLAATAVALLLGAATTHAGDLAGDLAGDAIAFTRKVGNFATEPFVARRARD